MLNDTQIRQLQPSAKKRKVVDRDGLYLLVMPSGAKYWRFDYRFAGVRKTAAFGTYPDVRLAAARERVDTARRELAGGRDPNRARRVEERQRRQVAAVTFEAIGREWMEHQTPARRASTTERNTSVLEKYLYPHLGAYPITSIEPPELLELVRLIERAGYHETAHRAIGLASLIFRYAIATGRGLRDPARDLRGALKPVVTRSHAALLDAAKIGELLRAIDAFPGAATTRLALQLAPLVFVRPGELRRARWADVDLDAALWRIPRTDVKTNVVHLVPLASQALAVLAMAQRLAGDSPYVFPGARRDDAPMSDMALNGALRRLGYRNDEMTGHGFRAMARTRLDEVLHIPGEVIELQLAHKLPGPYNRARHWDARVAMMQAWADHLDGLRDEASGRRAASPKTHRLGVVR